MSPSEYESLTMRPFRSSVTTILTAFFVLFALSLCAAGCRSQIHPVPYPAVIDWQPYEAGIARAKAEQKPVMLIFGADWCEPCHVLAEHVLADPRVIEASKNFVMVHVNVQERHDLDLKYRRGGNTLPRIYFLNAEGALMKGARNPIRCRAHSYDKKDPTVLLAAMGSAQKLASDPATRPEEDPYEGTPAELAVACTPESTATSCQSCVRTRCCEETKMCLQNAESCICGNEQSSATKKALTACVISRCADVCRD
jgi:thiol-disulfide isomerase/thioredoxin